VKPLHEPGVVTHVLWRWTSTTPDAPARARTALRSALDQLGYQDTVTDDVVLAAAEFVANALEHGAGPYELRLRRTCGRVFCEVEDHDPRLPKVPSPVAEPLYAPHDGDRGGGLDALCARLAVRGRGLQIVHELTGGCWGFRRTSRLTKAAWLALPGDVSLSP
jgi:anti-sigma regulatory factor (Ser/Thr protein kinase)